MFKPFERGSSDIDWCEGNYVVSSSIAEFANTTTNIYYILFPPLLMYLSRAYAHHVTPAIHLVWGMLIVVGLTSAYFHATLSMVGQLLDELAILWVLITATALWIPSNTLPTMFRKNRQRFERSCIVAGIVVTVLAFVEPVLNAFILLLYSLPICLVLLLQLKRCINPRIKSLAIRTTVTWAIGIVCWINDRVFCDIWMSAFRFQYFHAIFHILIFHTSYQSCIIFAYFHSMQTKLHKQPDLAYWPWNWFEYGVPYVTFKSASSVSYKVKKFAKL